MMIDYNCNTYHGVCDDWKSSLGILIKHLCGPKIKLVFDEENDRDTLYTNLLHQVQQHTGR